jgi:hypothetical protein
MRRAKEQLTQKFTALNDTNELFLKSYEEKMITKLQVKFGKTRPELQQIIDIISSRIIKVKGLNS